jgi:hypothetical protein
MRSCRTQRGSAIIEFVLTGIPMIFIWISIVQMCIGMWHYHTLQYAAKAAAMYVAHHGVGCASPNTCSIQIKDAASVLKTNAIGIPANEISVTFTSYSKSDIYTAAATLTCQLDSCLTNTTSWPPTCCAAVESAVQIKADYVFKSALCMVAPGPGAKVVNFGQFHLPGSAFQQILF